MAEQRSLEELRKAVNTEPVPIPDVQGQSLGDRALLAAAAVGNPEFRRARIDPLIQAGQDRPAIQAQAAEQARLNEIGAQQGLVGAEQNQQRVTAETDRVELLREAQRRDEVDRQNNREANLSVANAAAEAFDEESEEVAALIARMREADPDSADELSASWRVYRNLIEEFRAGGPDIDNPRAAEALTAQMDHVDTLRARASARGFATEQAAATAQAGLQEEQLKIAGRLAQEDVKQAGALERVQVAGQRISAATKKEVRKLEALATGFEDIRQQLLSSPLGGGIEGKLPTSFPVIGFLPKIFAIASGEEREKFAADLTNLNSFFVNLRSGAQVSDKEFERLEGMFATPSLRNEVNLVRVQRMLLFLQRNIDSLSGRASGSQGGASPDEVRAQFPLDFSALTAGEAELPGAQPEIGPEEQRLSAQVRLENAQADNPFWVGKEPAGWSGAGEPLVKDPETGTIYELPPE